MPAIIASTSSTTPTATKLGQRQAPSASSARATTDKHSCLRMRCWYDGQGSIRFALPSDRTTAGLAILKVLLGRRYAAMAAAPLVLAFACPILSAMQSTERAAAASPFEIEVFFDGACPLCVREMQMLRRKDRRQRIRFTDIAAPEFDAATIGVPWATLMARIHGRLPNGSLVEGVEVFRRLYAAVGFNSIVAATRLPLVAPLLELSYRLFAKNRLSLTGRCSDEACPAPGGSHG